MVKNNNTKKKIFTIFMSALIVSTICLPVSIKQGFALEKYANAGLGDSPITQGDTTIVFTDDIHGHIDLEAGQGNNQVGFATASKVKKDASEIGNKSYLVDAGDEIQGTSYALYDWGHSIVDLMNTASYDFCIPGNHETDYKASYLENDISKKSNNGYYACNFQRKTTDGQWIDVFDKYKILDATNGKKIALVGIMTPEAMSDISKFTDEHGNQIYRIQGSDAVSSEDFAQNVVQPVVDDIKNNNRADFVVCVGHLGENTPVDPHTINSEGVISYTNGIDVFIDAHSHHVINDTIANSEGKQIHRLQAGGFEGKAEGEEENQCHIGVLNIKQNGENLEFDDASIINKYDNGVDESVLDKEKSIIKRLDGDIIAHNETKFIGMSKDSEGKRAARIHETNSTDFITDSFYYYGLNANPIGCSEPVHCDGSIINAAGATDLVTGDIKEKDMFDVFKFGNQFFVAEVSGQTIKDAFEWGVRNWDGQTECTGLLHSAGIAYSFDASIESTVQSTPDGRQWAGSPTGEYRVKDIRFYNKNTGVYELIDLNKKYNIAAPSYILASYGDGFTMFKDCKLYSYNDDKGSVVLENTVLSTFIKAFKNVSTINYNDNLPVINSKNSPFYELKNYIVDYENQSGSETRLVEYSNLQTVEKPTVLETQTYNGQLISGIDCPFVNEKYALKSGCYQAVEAGNYKAEFSLMPGFKWDDNTTSDISFDWSIAAAGSSNDAGSSNENVSYSAQTGDNNENIIMFYMVLMIVSAYTLRRQKIKYKN